MSARQISFTWRYFPIRLRDTIALRSIVTFIGRNVSENLILLNRNSEMKAFSGVKMFSLLTMMWVPKAAAITWKERIIDRAKFVPGSSLECSASPLFYPEGVRDHPVQRGIRRMKLTRKGLQYHRNMIADWP